jgi:hypothetical protein
MGRDGAQMAIDEKKLNERLARCWGDVGAAMGTALVLLGDKFGFYKTLASDGPLSPAELASRTGTERVGARLRETIAEAGVSCTRDRRGDRRGPPAAGAHRRSLGRADRSPLLWNEAIASDLPAHASSIALADLGHTRSR